MQILRLELRISQLNYVYTFFPKAARRILNKFDGFYFKCVMTVTVYEKPVKTCISRNLAITYVSGYRGNDTTYIVIYCDTVGTTYIELKKQFN